MDDAQRDGLIQILKDRFGKNMQRHVRLEWQAVQDRLLADAKKLQSLSEMERSGGEPDVTGIDRDTRQFIFCDCSPESPSGRRSLCYDRAALDGRKENKPGGNAVEMAAAMGITLLSEGDYRALQRLGEFDRKTSSWVDTPDKIRRLGGAVFCDRRYDQVFLYHNGADSYYAARGFRAMIRV